VGIGAVVFSVLYNNRIKDIVFNYDKVLNFDGETGPYVQYTHARCSSVLQKGEPQGEIDYNGINNPEGQEVIKLLERFPSIVRDAAEKNEPCFVGRLAVDLAQAYNKFYIEHRIINAETTEIRNARLLLTKAVKQTLSNALGLLGIAAPTKM
jgi:arginyl-tRNA synthetase